MKLLTEHTGHLERQAPRRFLALIQSDQVAAAQYEQLLDWLFEEDCELEVVTKTDEPVFLGEPGEGIWVSPDLPRSKVLSVQYDGFLYLTHPAERSEPDFLRQFRFQNLPIVRLDETGSAAQAVDELFGRGTRSQPPSRKMRSEDIPQVA
ncbi:MAG: hypothetical protein Q7Q71_08925 [Verrucomicrobiota bacterium JB023]|nr:hypothetical protein [Verrucomicrobiota bacterium JB023]